MLLVDVYYLFLRTRPDVKIRYKNLEAGFFFIVFFITFTILKIYKMSGEKEAKLKALQLTLDKLDKTYGKGTVMKMGDKAIVEVETISSGSLGLDLALGVNGYPRGRVIEIYGPESSGKTTLTLHAIAEAQKAC